MIAIMAAPIITKIVTCACGSQTAIAGLRSTTITTTHTPIVRIVITPAGTVPGTATGPGITSTTLIADGTLAVATVMAMVEES